MLPLPHRPASPRSHYELAFVLVASFLLSACAPSASKSSHSIEQQIEQSVAALQIFDFKQAYHSLNSLQPTLAPDSEHWALATYSYGLAAWFKTPTTKPQVDLAISLLKSVVEHQPKSELAASALLDLGRIAEVSDYIGDPTDALAAQAYYEQVRKQFPRSKMSTRASLFLAQTYAQSLEADDIRQAIHILEECITEQADDEWVGVLGQYTGQLYATYLNEAPAAIEPYLLAVDAGLPRVATRDAALWQLGILAEKAEQQAVAIRIYKRIIENYPRTKFGTVAQERFSYLTKRSLEAASQ